MWISEAAVWKLWLWSSFYFNIWFSLSRSCYLHQYVNTIFKQVCVGLHIKLPPNCAKKMVRREVMAISLPSECLHVLVKSHMDLSNTALIKINFALVYYLYKVFSGAPSVRFSKTAIQRLFFLENLWNFVSFSQTLGLENAWNVKTKLYQDVPCEVEPLTNSRCTPPPQVYILQDVPFFTPSNICTIFSNLKIIYLRPPLASSRRRRLLPRKPCQTRQCSSCTALV